MPLFNLDPPGAKKILFTSFGEIWSLFTRILNIRLSLGVSLGSIPSWCIIIEWNNWCFCWLCYHLILLLFCFNRTMESVNRRWHLWEDVPFAQNLSRHKKLHDLTKPCEMCMECIRCERMDNYKGTFNCVQRSLLLLLLLKHQHLDVSLVTNHSQNAFSIRVIHLSTS